MPRRTGYSRTATRWRSSRRFRGAVRGEGRDRMMSERKRFEITTEPLSLDDVAGRVSDPACGAITTFAGVVRGETTTAEGVRGTDFLHYEAYAEMAEGMLAQIAGEIQERWPKVAAVS